MEDFWDNIFGGGNDDDFYVAPGAETLNGGDDEDGGFFEGGLFQTIATMPFIQDTIGAVLENGFDLSCWGSSTSPADAERWMQNQLAPMYNRKMQQLNSITDVKQLSEEVTDLDKQLSAIEKHQLFHKDESRASCSKKGNQLKADGAKSFLMALRSHITKQSDKFNVSKTTVTFKASDVRFDGVSTNWKGRTIMATHQKYVITKKSIVSNVTDILPSSVQNASMGKGLGLLLILGVLYKGGSYIKNKFFGNNIKKLAKWKK